jgi:integrase
MDGAIALPPREIGAGRTKPGTLDAVVASYLTSQHWEGLAENSKRNRRGIMERLRTVWGSVLLRDVAVRHARSMIDGAGTGHQRKHALKVARALFAHAIDIGLIEQDPSVGLRVRLPTSEGFHTWLAAEVSKFRAHWPLGTQQRLALELALETASRRTEITRIGRQHVKGGRIRVARVKGCDHVDLKVSPALQAALDAMPAATDQLTYLIARNGQPYTPEQLGREFSRWASEAGLPQRCRLHGLRKARTAELASKGASAHLIMSITGHRSLSEVQRYADKYNRREAADAAMALLLKTGTEV